MNSDDMTPLVCTQAQLDRLIADVVREERRAVTAELELAAHAEEVRRLREALEEIREWAGGLGWLGSPQDERVEAECLAILARRALAEVPGE